MFCAAYRLAPETAYPGALDDAEESYRYLLSKGFEPQQICLCGESAGGGLIYALLLYLRRGYFFIFGGAFILTGLYNVLIEFLLNVTFQLHEGFIWSV